MVDGERVRPKPRSGAEAGRPRPSSGPAYPSIMSAGATDGLFLRNAGIPTYGHSGLASDVDDVRAHGKDERVATKSFFDGGEYLYRLVKRLSGGT